MQFGKNLAARMPMQTMFGSVAKDGDQMFVAVPENKTLEFYQYLRGYGLCFTVDCRGFCEDNVFCFGGDENRDMLDVIVGKFRIRE